MKSQAPFRRAVSTFTACACAIALAASAGAQTYTVVDLGTLGGPISRGFGLNDSNQAVGWSRFDYVNPIVVHAYLWTSGKMTDLGTLTDPKGRRTSEAYAINRDGLVVGKSYATVGVHAFLWLPTPMFGLPPGLNDLGTLGGTSSWAYAINSNAKIVGQAYLSGSGIPRPVIWEPAGTGGMVVRDLGTLGGTFGRARAINEAGAIVGVSSLGTGGSTQACIWLDQPRYGLPAGVTQLVFNGGTSTECYDINNHGQVVGRAQIGGGFVWLPEPAFGLPAGVTSFAADPWRIRECNAINDAGDIAATSIDVEGIPHGVVLRGTTLIDLSTAVRPRDQWQVVDAFDVNSDGVVVGSAVRNGEQHAVLLIPIGLRQAITTLEPDDRTTP